MHTSRIGQLYPLFTQAAYISRIPTSSFSDLKMVRTLKYHEQKLLKKVDFINWEEDNSPHENKIMRRFQVEKREVSVNGSEGIGRIL